jgi:hypothetical protein
VSDAAFADEESRVALDRRTSVDPDPLLSL